MTNTTITPKTLTATELFTALKPLYDLLGVTPRTLFGDRDSAVRVHMDADGHGHVTFHKVVSNDLPDEDWPKVRVGEPEYGEVAYDVDVTVSDWLYSEVLNKLWPDEVFPVAIRAASDEGAALLGETSVCPECRQGKCVNCTGKTLDTATDEMVWCTHGCHK